MKFQLKFTWPLLILIGFVAIFSLSFDLVGMVFLLSTSLSAIFLGIAATRQASLLLIYWIFSFTFLGLVPWLHYSQGFFIWLSFPLGKGSLIHTNLIIFVANLLVFIAHNLSYRNRQQKRASLPIIVRRPDLSSLVLAIIAALGFFGVFYINSYDIRLLMFRGVVDQSRDAVFTSSAASLMFNMISRMAPVFAFYFVITQIPGKQILKAILLILLVLSVFPTGVARYMVAYAYIPMLMIMVPYFRSGTAFALILLLSLLFIFPFLEQFRYFSGFDDFKFLPQKEFFFAAHFDAFENLASAMESNFVTNGNQLLGVLLFFVPRTTWPDKPSGSGFELAQSLGYTFNNISMPFIGEGYVNFGLAGVVLFAIFIGYLMGRLDRALAPAHDMGQKLTYPNAVYYFLFGALFFVLRGDLMSSFAYLSASLTVALFISWLMRLLNSRSRT